MADSGDVPNPVRLAWEKAAREVGQDSTQPFPPGPYHVHSANLIYLRCAFGRKRARELLPPELEPDDDGTGTIAIYTVGGGFAIAPYSAGYFGISVQGHNSPDGDVACLKLGDFRSGVWGTIYRSRYLEQSRPGWSNVTLTPDMAVGEAGPPGATALRIRGRRTGHAGDEVSGVNVFLGKRPDAPGFNSWTVASSSRWQDLADVSVEILDAAPEVLKRMQPDAILWPLLVEDFTMTFSPPTPIDTPAEERAATIVRTGLVDLFSRLGRPALIVARGGKMLHINDAARALSGDGLTTGASHLRAGNREAQTALETAVAEVIATGYPAEPIAVPRRGGMPLLVHAMPLAADAALEPAALLLIADPEQPHRGDAGRTLQLLGLTPAEARLAALVGSGQSPRESAKKLDITEGTARTTLKTVFGKLAISRQSELARLVARIDVS